MSDATPSPQAHFEPSSLLRILRPKQWTKNGPLLAALIFSRKLFQPDDLKHALLALVAFCLLSGSVYVFNDIADREKDRVHPEKKKRAIASGALPVPLAWGWGFVCLAVALGLAFSVNLKLGQICVTYAAMQGAYSAGLKKVAILDVMIIAIGFVLRVIGGAVAITVPVSSWLYLCTLCLALFLGFCKRRHELLLLDGDAVLHRASLRDYSPQLLDQLIGTTTAMTLISYALYTMSPETVDKFHTENLLLTIPFVVYGVFRYLLLVYKKDQGGSPDRVLLTDVPMITTILLFLVVSVAVIYSGS
jgi:4-hydroxybenzoate polyprenyltransferase